MVGTITVSGVAPAAVPLTPVPTRPSGIVGPNTGTGPAPQGSGGWLPAMLMFAIVGATLVLAGTTAAVKTAHSSRRAHNRQR